MGTNLSHLEKPTDAATFWHHVENRKNGNIKDWRHYASLKLFIEVGETIDPLVKWLFHDKPLSPDKVLEEVGDVFWYIASMSTLDDFCFACTMNERMENPSANAGSNKDRLKVACTALMLNWPDHQDPQAVTWRALVDIMFCFGWSFSEVFRYNIEKLEKRHGQQFNPGYYTTPQTPESQV